MRIDIEASDRRNGTDTPSEPEKPKRRRAKQAKLDRAATAHAWAAYEPPTRVPIRLSPGYPLPPQTAETHSPYSPGSGSMMDTGHVIHTFPVRSQPRNFGRHAAGGGVDP